MAIKTSPRKISDEPVQQVVRDDIDRLAKLMDESYRGTIDHEGETLEQCKEEMRATLSGKYGPYIKDADFFKGSTSDEFVFAKELK